MEYNNMKLPTYRAGCRFDGWVGRFDWCVGQEWVIYLAWGENICVGENCHGKSKVHFSFYFQEKHCPVTRWVLLILYEWHRVSPSSLSVSLPWLFAVMIRGLERIRFEEKRQCQCQNAVCASVLQGFKCISHSPSKETRKGKRDPGSCLFYTLLLKGKYSLGLLQKQGKAEKHKLRQMMGVVKDGQERRI